MNDHSTREQIASITARMAPDPAAAYIADAGQVLLELRKRMLAVEAEHHRRRHAVAERARDELHALDVQHGETMRKLARLAERIEAVVEE